ncbi:MAG TPA: monovalent cation/H+ antiporter complex subunit F [Aggregatilineales bacterium]|jgi:multicomponent Na+:H+ antiporter subunit F|nr:monovalent cation/H+ antiporter complex subunit F [Aggregatilineales bacterium]
MLSSFALGIFTVLLLGVVLSLGRLVKGPKMADRVVVIDLLATIGIGMIVAYAIATDEPVFMDVTAIIGIVGFLGTIAFAYYLQRKADD